MKRQISAWALGATGAAVALAIGVRLSSTEPSEIRPEPPTTPALAAAAPVAPAPPAGIELLRGQTGPSSWPASFHPTAAQPTPMTVCLKHDGTPGDAICPGNDEASWPADFHPTPERPTPMTTCIKDDGPSGGVICPGTRDQLTLKLR